MDWHGPGFVVALVVISTIGWVLTTAIRARYNYPITDDCGTTVDRHDAETARHIETLSAENGRLKAMIVRLEERVAVLERIATDRGPRLADEIEALR